MEHAPLNSRTIKAWAKSLGFVACGIAPAEAVQPWSARQYMRRLELGYYADMQYIYNNVEKRLQPALLMEGVRSIVSVALNYMPPQQQPAISLYAQGKDYHDVMRQRLQQLLSAIQATGRCFVDTAPVMERYWAWRAGIGEFCRNGLISVPGYGPTVFLGELFIMEEVDSYDEPVSPPPAFSEGWESVCPALTADGVDARRCKSYLTIEHRGPFDEPIRFSKTFYGCDKCLRACTQFQESLPTKEEAFMPSPALLAMTPEDWRGLTVEQYQTLFKGSAVKCAKYEGLLRNIAAWEG